MLFMAVSGNPRIVNGFYKHSYINILFDCSFNASAELVELMDLYRKKYKISLVHRDYPFSLKKPLPRVEYLRSHRKKVSVPGCDQGESA